MLSLQKLNVVRMLSLIRSLGMACEVASPGEYKAAVAAGFNGGEIVFDSQAKTNW